MSESLIDPLPWINAPATKLVHLGRDPLLHWGMVNTPPYRGSTILASSLQEWESRKLPGNPYASYARFGTPTTASFESAIAALEGGFRAQVFPSGLAAITHTLLSLLEPGDHLLLSDSVYGPTRSFAMHTLRRFGVEVEFYDPLVGRGIDRQIRPSTKVIFVESPGSATFEIQDIPAISSAAHKRGVFVVMDNTWATPLGFRAFDHGVDVAVQAATKYLVGHSDALLGIATANEVAWDILQAGAHAFGQIAGPDDVYLALRGMRTLSVRLERHWANGLELAQFLSKHDLVEHVFHPGLTTDPGHEIWRRDFTGGSGLFAIALKPIPRNALERFFERLELFGIGLSWGGFESLCLPLDPPERQFRPVPFQGPILRIHAGLEAADDLIRDFDHALRRIACC